jgi:hypothetical protein
MTQDKSTKVAELAFKWCQLKWGSPLKTKDCDLVISYDRRYKRYYGSYVNRVIKVFPLNCKTKKDIIKTIIHEYCHFLQMPSLPDNRIYCKLDEEWGYDLNPFEVQAREFENKYYKKCKKFIKDKLNEEK